MKRSAVGLDDVARRAGVSTATVSRALNDQTSALVRPEARERIQALAREMNYRVHSGARNLRRQRSEIIALVNRAPHRQVSDPFFSELTGEISEDLERHGYDVLLSQRARHGGDWIDHLVLGRRVDGLVITHRAIHDPDLDRLIEIGVPFVVLGRPIAGQRYVSTGSDNDRGGYLVGRHLIDLGHRRIGVISGTLSKTESSERFQGFRRALAEADITLPRDWVFETDYNLTRVQEGMVRLLEVRPAITAVFVASDLMAIAAIEALRRQNLRVPEDISILSFDDIPLAAYSSPALTTVHQDIRRIGHLLAEQVVAQIEGLAVESTTLPVKLVLRSSTAPPRETAREKQ